MAESEEHVALLLDFENLVIAFEQKGARRMPDAVNLPVLIDFLEENFGNVIFRRAYADWAARKFNVFQTQLQDMGVEMNHVVRRTSRSKKNGADILLTADAVELLLLRPFINIYAIVSGDSDIGPLITKLKSHGKTVVVIGPDEASTAKHVIELADRFKFYNDIAQVEEQPARAERRQRRMSPYRAIIDILRKNDEPMEAALLKRDLTAISEFSNFNQKALGFKTWTSFLRSIDKVKVRHRSDLAVEVGLREWDDW